MHGTREGAGRKLNPALSVVRCGHGARSGCGLAPPLNTAMPNIRWTAVLPRLDRIMRCQVTDAGCSELAEAVAVNSSLVALQYGHCLPQRAQLAISHHHALACEPRCSAHANAFGSVGCSKLAEALAVNQTLRTLMCVLLSVAQA